MGQRPAKTEDSNGGTGVLPSSSVATGTSATGNATVTGYGAGQSVARTAHTPPPASWAFQLLPGLYNHYQKVAADIFRRFEFGWSPSGRIHFR